MDYLDGLPRPDTFFYPSMIRASISKCLIIIIIVIIDTMLHEGRESHIYIGHNVIIY